MITARSFRVGLLATTLLGLPACATAPRNNPQPIAIDAVIRQVKNALADVQVRLAESGMPPLKQVTLTLQTEVTKKVGGSLKLWVLGVGDTYEKDHSQQIELVLVPPPPPPSPTVKSLGLEDLSLTDELEAAILSAADGIAKSGLGDGPVRLQTNGVTITLGFTVQNAANGSASVVISPVTAGLTGNLSQTATQKLTVIFGGTR